MAFHPLPFLWLLLSLTSERARAEARRYHLFLFEKKHSSMWPITLQILCIYQTALLTILLLSFDHHAQYVMMACITLVSLHDVGFGFQCNFYWYVFLNCVCSPCFCYQQELLDLFEQHVGYSICIMSIDGLSPWILVPTGLLAGKHPLTAVVTDSLPS